MPASLEEAIKEAYASAPSNKVIFDTLEIRQTGVQDPIYIVKAPQGITALDENGISKTYRPAGFQFTMPAETEEGFRSLTIAVDNIDRAVGDFVQLAKSANVPCEVIYRPYLSDDLTQPMMNPPLLLYLKDIQVTEFQVAGRATFMDLVNLRFPSQLYTRARFPSLG